MNNRKTATISPVIANLDNSGDRHQLKLNLITTEEIPEKEDRSTQKAWNDLAVGDWVKKGSGRPGVIIDIKEVKPGYPSFLVKWSGDNYSTRCDRDSLTLIEDSGEKNWSIAEEILKYLEQEKDFIHEVSVAAELEIGVPVARKYLKELGNRVENDGDDNWRIVQCIDAEIVEECSHSWEFSPSPVDLGYVERCHNCDAVKSIDGSEKLSELISWLSLLVKDFERQANDTKDEREQAYYLDCANNKQQLINQVNRFKEKAVEQEKANQIETICDNNYSVSSEVVIKDDEKDRAEAIDLKAEIIKLISDFFVTLGEKLKYYRDNQLYRFEAETFGAWCEQEIGLKRAHAYRLIDGFNIYTCLHNNLSNTDDLSPVGDKGKNIPLPKSEYQVRALARLPEDQWYPTWVEAVEKNNREDKPPSGKLVERIVKEKKRMEKQKRYQPQVDRFKVGDVVRITAKHNPDLKEYHSCWGQVVSLEEHSYTVQTWKGEISGVAHDDLMLLPRQSKNTAENLLKKLHHSYQLHPKDPDLVAFLHYLGTKPIPEASELAIAFLNFVDVNNYDQPEGYGRSMKRPNFSED